MSSASSSSAAAASAPNGARAGLSFLDAHNKETFVSDLQRDAQQLKELKEKMQRTKKFNSEAKRLANGEFVDENGEFDIEKYEAHLEKLKVSALEAKKQKAEKRKREIEAEENTPQKKKARTVAARKAKEAAELEKLKDQASLWAGACQAYNSGGTAKLLNYFKGVPDPKLKEVVGGSAHASEDRSDPFPEMGDKWQKAVNMELDGAEFEYEAASEAGRKDAEKHWNKLKDQSKAKDFAEDDEL